MARRVSNGDGRGNGGILGGPPMDPILANAMRGYVENLTSISRAWQRMIQDPRRNIDDECGFPKGFVPAEFYADLYERDTIAARVVEVLPKECWEVTPKIVTDDKKFVGRFDEIGRRLRGTEALGFESDYKGKTGNPLWKLMFQLDVVAGIGRYGVALLGVDDGELDLSRPIKGFREENSSPLFFATKNQEVQVISELVDPRGNKIREAVTFNSRVLVPDAEANEKEKRRFKELVANSKTADVKARYVCNADDVRSGMELKYVMVFPESLALCTQFEANPDSPRYGLPVMYLLTFNDPREQGSGVGLPLATKNVHWSRVVHFADNLHASRTFGFPRMRQRLNNILSLRKIYGSSPEGCWRQAFTTTSFETQPQLGGDVEINRQEMEDQIEQVENGLQKYFLLRGMTAKPLPPGVLDPTPHKDAQLEAICISIPCPMRVFKGSARGELASAQQDDEEWNDVKRARQERVITPHLIVPFVDRLQLLKVLPRCKGGWELDWPSVDSLGQKDKAQILAQRTQALIDFVGQGGEQLIGAKAWLKKEFDYSEEEIEEAMQEAQAKQEELMSQSQDLADEQGFVPEPPDGFKEPEPIPDQTIPDYDQEATTAPAG